MAEQSRRKIKLRAERKAGEILAEMPRAQGRQPEEITRHRDGYYSALESASIPEATARRWQQVAAIPEPVFEEHIEHTKQAESELTTAGML